MVIHIYRGTVTKSWCNVPMVFGVNAQYDVFSATCIDCFDEFRLAYIDLFPVE